MQKRILFFLIIGAIVFIASTAFASDISDIRNSLQNVRERLLVLLTTENKTRQMELIEKIAKLTQAIDSNVDHLIASAETSDDLQQKILEFQFVWGEFKKTRDEEIIPRILTGEKEKLEEAKQIARSIQAERYQKMRLLLQ